MKILALETSTLTGSVALLSEACLIGEITLSVELQHSERLLPAIDRLLHDAHVSLPDLDAMAVAQGPGSFTGLRVGIAAAQGLALAAGKPLVGVSSLEGLAMNGSFFNGIVIPLFNAFRGEVYRGLYRCESGILLALAPDGVSAPDRLKEELGSFDGRFLLLGNGFSLVQEMLIQAFGAERILVPPLSQMLPRASHIGVLALRKLSSTKGTCFAPIVPTYLRKAG